MNTQELDVRILKALNTLGLNEHNYKAVCLLPLVEVAWADGGIQEQERKLILDIARGHELLRAEEEAIVEGWLTHKPDEEHYELGRKLLVKLAFRKRGLGAKLPERAVESVVDFCSLVAESAGGLFDTYWTVSPSERKAIRGIAEHLNELSLAENPHLGIVGHTLEVEWKVIAQQLGMFEETEPVPYDAHDDDDLVLETEEVLNED